MTRLACLAPLAAGLALWAAPAMADPASINVILGPDVLERADELGEREVQAQASRLSDVVRQTLARRGALDGAEINLTLTDLKPNRPTMQQMADRPGLDGIRSISIGGATITGHVTTADGLIHPVEYDWYSTSIADVRGFGIWQDADRAYSRLANNLAVGRYQTR
ncbi:MAG: hypothetical protein PSV23_07450 [Brevundimonas sp.]|uniref:hypothetical protein n=1 Tax=Brevundimonas sp. TaxID=1871086 RepID=UPI0024873A13|nr:hypothetical protein [Brevundimonas sp.]MDI1326620.1 hypothetical protein [Brevundimonas sp.]